MKRKLAILGSTGSIGTQTLDVVRNYPERFEAYVITAYNNAELLIKQALEFEPDTVVIGNKAKYSLVQEALRHTDVKVYAGEEAIVQVAAYQQVDMVLTAMVGYAGLRPTLEAIKAGKPIALANKETLVVAGELVMGLAREARVPIIPVDSEHSAIFQCLVGEAPDALEKILLTASGGPFRNHSMDELQKVTRKEALNHPNWDMGAKITIDSASFMNKGFEVIEAKWLFDLRPDQIEVVVHPQSIIHSMVQFKDSSLKAQLGLPDMRVPIQYAVSFPERLKAPYPRFNFLDYPTLTFEKPDLTRFRNLALAYRAMEEGGNVPCVLNAANEEVVAAFLKEQVGFLDMSDIIEKTLHRVSHVKTPSYDDYVATDAEARRIALELISDN